MVAELIFGDQKRKRTRKNDNHMMTSTPPALKGPFHAKSGPWYINASSSHTLWHRAYAPCSKRAFGMFLRARHVLDACIHIRTVLFQAVGRSRLLILAPLSNPEIKSRIREKIHGGQHFLRITLYDSNGCAGLLVFLCVSSTCGAASRQPYKPESRNGEFSWNKVLELTSKRDTAVA